MVEHWLMNITMQSKDDFVHVASIHILMAFEVRLHVKYLPNRTSKLHEICIENLSIYHPQWPRSQQVFKHQKTRYRTGATPSATINDRREVDKSVKHVGGICNRVAKRRIGNAA